MNSYLLYLILVFGLATLLTYWKILFSDKIDELWGDWGYKSKLIWKISTFITTISFLFMSCVFIWPLENWEYSEQIFLCYCIFFSGAVLWAPFTLLAVEIGQKDAIVFVCLTLSSLGSGILFVLVAVYCKDKTFQIPMIITSLFVALHHLILDTVWWWRNWYSNDYQSTGWSV